MHLEHTKKILIDQEHLDSNHHVNNVQYVHWVEMIAAEHWNILKTETPYTDDYWVLLDHHIQYKKQVLLGDILTIKTYPEQVEGLKQPRIVEFYVNNSLVVISRTLWVLMSKKDNKIIRLPKDWLFKS